MSPSSLSQDAYQEVPILIVGGGPSGLLLGYLLAQLGVRTLIIERYATRLAAPKAHALSPRSLELARQFGLDVNEIRQIGTSRKDAYWVNFITNLAGEEVGRLPYERMDPEVLDATPTMIHNIPQPAFESYVIRKLANTSLCEVRKNNSFVRLSQHENYVLTTVHDRDSDREYIIKSTHAVACDGAKSAVRRFLGVESEGEDSYETMMTIHINADLRPVVGDRVGMLHWVMDPETSGFIIGYDLSGNQVLICNVDPDRHPIDSWNEDLSRHAVDAAIGKQIPYDVLSYRPWVLSRKVAKSYRVQRVFLAGDAAHSFPPTGGLGLNSGLGDVHNLAYKLAAVHQGWGGEGLLDTYGFERRQVALVNSQQSVKNGQKIFSLLKKLGTTDRDVALARRNLHRNLHDPNTMAQINQGIEEQREHFDNLGLHIGYIYGDTRIPYNASIYRPICIPGARLPHAWIQPLAASTIDLPAIDSSYVVDLSPKQIEQKQYSTLDLCAFDGFTILTDVRHTSIWEQHVQGLYQKIPAAVAESLAIRMVVLGRDFHLVPGEHSQLWVEIMRLHEGQATLVRPDQHILSCFDSATTRVTDLLHALHDHLQWPTQQYANVRL